MIFSSNVAEFINAFVMVRPVNALAIISGAVAMQYFTLFNLLVSKTVYLFLLILLNSMSTFIAIAKLLPIDVQLVPEDLRILNKVPKSSGWDISVILVSILDK